MTEKRDPEITRQSAADTAAQSADPPKKAGQDAAPAKGGKPKKKRDLWAVKITVISLFLSAFISFLTELTSSAENIAVTVVILLFLIAASIMFDGIGVSVTSCDITPIVSMASKKEYGAKTAMWLVKNNEKVSNVCNDVIGDIFGIISGACGAAIAIRIVTMTDESWEQWTAIAVSAVVSALTIGGKAFLKNIAISKSKEFVLFVARIIAVFDPEERRRRRKAAEKKKKYAAKAAAADGQSRPSERGKDPKRTVGKLSSKKTENTTAETEAAPLEEQPAPEPDPAVSLGDRSAPEATGGRCDPDPEGGAQDET